MLIWFGCKIHFSIWREAMTRTLRMICLKYVNSSPIFGKFRVFYLSLISGWFWCQIKPLNHSHDLPAPDQNGETYICSCMIYLRPTNGAKLLMKKWSEELQSQAWSESIRFKANDQPAFNFALNKTAHQVSFCVLHVPFLQNQRIESSYILMSYKCWIVIFCSAGGSLLAFSGSFSNRRIVFQWCGMG